MQPYLFYLSAAFVTAVVPVFPRYSKNFLNMNVLILNLSLTAEHALPQV